MNSVSQGGFHPGEEARQGSARGYQPNDRAGLDRALDKIAPLDVKVLAPMHGPTIIGHYDRFVRAFRENSLAA